MATIALQRLRPFEGNQQASLIGPVTGTVYTVNALGQVTVAQTDGDVLVAQGWNEVSPGENSGTSLIDFGAFPGSDFASVTIVALPSDPDAVLMGFVVPALTDDHSLDEHLVDSPMVNAYSDGGGNVVIVGVPRPGVNSPLPPSPMPYGKWSVGYAFLQ